MSDDVSAGDDIEPSDERPWEAPPADWLLQSLVGLLNGTDNAVFGMTLHISGLIISGNVISGKEYFKIFSDTMAASLNNDNNIKKYFDASEIYDDKNPMPAGYIHMKDAKVFATSGNPVPQNGVLWRGRIAQVDGFSMGILKAQ